MPPHVAASARREVVAPPQAPFSAPASAPPKEHARVFYRHIGIGTMHEEPLAACGNRRRGRG